MKDYISAWMAERTRKWLVVVTMTVVIGAYAALALLVIAPENTVSRHITADRATKLPASVPSVFGPVAITTEKGLVDEDSTSLYGRAFLPQLRIVLREGMSQDFSLYILDHEVCHIALLEVPLPDDGTEEAVCDAIAKQRAAERR
jgi:hypothetical protein